MQLPNRAVFWSRTAKLTVEVLLELVATIQSSPFTCIRGATIQMFIPVQMFKLMAIV
jgi:hypothetical protein